MYIVRTTEAAPTPVYLSILLIAVELKTAQSEAFEKIITILPKIHQDDLSKVNRKLWKSLYKYAVNSLLEHKQIVFQTALLLKDFKALPYLKRIVNKQDLHTDSTERLKLMLQEFQRLI